MLWSLISTDTLDRLLDQQGWPPERFADSYALLLRSAFVAEAVADPPTQPPDARAALPREPGAAIRK